MRTPTLPLDAVLEALPDAVVVVDAAGTIAHVNQRAEAMFGRAREGLLGQAVEQLLPERHRGAQRLRLASTAMGTAVEVDALHADGRELPVEVMLSPLAADGGHYTVAVMRDVTERRQSERMRVRARQQAAVAALGQRALAGEDPARLAQRAADALADVLGVELVEVLELLDDGETLAVRGVVGPHPVTVPRADSQAGLSLRERVAIHLIDTGTETRFDAEGLRDHGVVSGLSVPMLVGGRPLGAVGVHVRRPRAFSEDDVHFTHAVANLVAGTMARRSAEEALARTSGRLQAVLDASPMPLVIKDLEGRIVLANRAFEETWAFPAGGAAGRRSGDIVDADTATMIDDHDRAVIAGGEPVEVERRIEIGGRERVHLVTKFPLVDETGAAYGLAILSTDISERAELEARLARAERLESVGQLAGGIAHDFNNLLAVIANHAAFVRRSVAHGSQAAEDLEQILAACGGAEELTRRLLQFSRRRAGNPEVVDLATAIAETERLLRRTLGEQVALRTVVEPGLWRVTADRGQLEQVLVNLALNARDAMGDGGELLIHARNVVLDGEDEALRGEAVCLEVSDTGAGMAGEVADRAFEPFFTTKTAGEGTGLGLSTVYGIVRGAGGQIDLRSAPGEGTTVVVHLPASRAPLPLASAATEQAPPPGRGELVLVVEDKEAVRELAARILGDAGYVVRTAADGREALAAHGPDVRALLTDVVMPGLGGRELADALRGRHPGLPVVLMSGYTDDHVVESVREEGATAFVQKPFAAAELLAALRQVLDAAGTD